MSYQCEQCSESSTLGDTTNTLIKIATLGAICYVAFTFKSQLKDIVGKAIGKAQKHLEGAPEKKLKSPGAGIEKINRSHLKKGKNLKVA